VPTFLRSPLGPGSLVPLLKHTVGGTLFVFLLLQIWRPYYFLTDDNFTAIFPALTEIGRHLKAGQSPFVSNYVFGGNFDFTRDLGALFWHPFYLLPALVADTRVQFAMLDLIALCFLLLTTVGFTVLAHSVVNEFNPRLKAGYIVFYTLSFLFSSYVLMVGPSWISFLSSQSALPWLALGILHRKLIPGTILIGIFTLHELVGAYAALTLSSAICLTLFAFGVALLRRSPLPFFSWLLGNSLAFLIASPFLARVLDGFAHTNRAGGVSVRISSSFNISPTIFPFSFFVGNWAQALAPWVGDDVLQTTVFPYASIILACAAAWCLVPMLLSSSPWRPLEILCGALMIFLVVLIIRPYAIGVVMHELPFFRSMRWPFRECLQLLFFFHLLLLIRPWAQLEKWMTGTVLFSFLVFVLPLPFGRIPTFNAFTLDRGLLFSGKAQAYWDRVRPQLDPSGNVVTIIDSDLWGKGKDKIPWTLLDTGNFPDYFRVRSISGYAPTAPSDQTPLSTYPIYWFGAFDTKQIPEILAARPDLEFLILDSTDPLKISLVSKGKKTDLTPYF
jgi:hypothetical protein